MFDLKISGIAGGGAFLLSLLLGFFSGAAFAVILLRALLFAVVFFVIASAGYFLITRFLPELLDGAGGGSAARDGPGRPGSLVNISLDDGDVFPGGAAPRGSAAAESELGDISSLMGGGEPVSPARAEFPASPPGEAGGGSAGDFPAGLPLDTLPVFTGEPSVGVPRGPSAGGPGEFPGRSPAGLDQNDQAGYTQGGLEEESPFGELLPLPQEPAAAPAASAAPGASSGEPELVEISSPDEALPDLDAMVGAFSGAEGEISADPVEKPAGRKPSTAGKPSKMEGDFNPKELAAAIRDRLKRE